MNEGHLFCLQFTPQENVIIFGGLLKCICPKFKIILVWSILRNLLVNCDERREVLNEGQRKDDHLFAIHTPQECKTLSLSLSSR